MNVVIEFETMPDSINVRSLFLVHFKVRRKNSKIVLGHNQLKVSDF